MSTLHSSLSLGNDRFECPRQSPAGYLRTSSHRVHTPALPTLPAIFTRITRNFTQVRLSASTRTTTDTHTYAPKQTRQDSKRRNQTP